MSTQNLITIVVIAGLFYVGGQYVSSQPQRVAQEAQANREITVSGEGKVTARPDVAAVTLGVTTGPQATAEVAMTSLSRRFNAVVEAVRGEGVTEDDIKTTNLSINPVYDYRDGQQTLRGFEASESIELKIRALDSIGTVLSHATQEGVNQAGGIQFVIDDPTALQLKAEAAAIGDAQEKARTLAKTLNVGLGRVKTFSTAAASNPPPVFFPEAKLSTADAGSAPPPVLTGTNEISANVQITYELQ